MRKICFIVPVFNEQHAIGPFLAAVSAISAELNKRYNFEIIFINDGSTDDTLQTILGAAATVSNISVLDLSRNFGKEAALTAGLDFANGDAVIPMDVDLQDPPAVVKDLIAKWEDGYEVVNARRVDRSSDSARKRVAARWFYRLHNAIAESKIPENVGDFRLLDKCAVEAIRRLPERRRFMKGLFAWIGFKTTTIDYARPPRVMGATKFSGWRLWKLAVEGITSFSTVLLEIWTYIGLIVALIAFCYIAVIISITIIRGVDVPGYASTLAAILLVGGLQLMGLGIIGQYIGRIYNEVKQRPTYIVRNIHSGKRDDGA